MIELTNIQNSYYSEYTAGENIGYITFTYSDETITVLGGVNTSGELVPEVEILNEVQGKINPTKVFRWVAKVLKATLCPECT